ncbi:quinon protein alcohol dehydrogenase-like superfamily [Lineolata rhizophorae]|uniref:Quinon protein alcohol dehydrogenase-like superfamily n=1 Tax=Lineolata rhizophorae TaxID=578093 RepID=A0A6A6NR93_9PEZI|nr:quinon protein alcohol dehydrogenase-like superfamily [Lineolata rhizophorae]
MSAHDPHSGQDVEDDDNGMLDAAEAEEEVQDEGDAAMDSGSDVEEIQLENDSAAYFDGHKDSIFCIAQHPVHPEIVVTGGGDDVAHIFDSTPPPRPVLPASYESNPQPAGERAGLASIFKIDGHTDSVNAVAFTLPKGEFVASAGLDGRLRAYRADPSGRLYRFVGEAQEVDEINWLASCPHPDYPNTLALGAGDGSVWVYTLSVDDPASPLTIVQAFYLHTGPCTAGAWTPDGTLLATVAEDGTFYVWDVFGAAAAGGIADAQVGGGGQAVVGLTPADERFRVDGGLYSVAVSPGGALAAVGGAEGKIRIVGLPRLGGAAGVGSTAASGAKGAGARSKAGGGKQAGGPKTGGGGRGASAAPSAGQAGEILASLQAQSDGVESLSFSAPPMTYLAAGSVDGSIALFDAAHGFAVRRHIRAAHEEEAVIKVEFVRPAPGAPVGPGGMAAGSWLLTSCGNDGVLRRWDARGGTAAAAKGLVGEWRGHRGGGEGGGVLGFVQGGGGGRVVTAGDDHVSLVFETPIA